MHFVLQVNKYARNGPLISFAYASALRSRMELSPPLSEGSRKICELKTKHLSHRSLTEGLHVRIPTGEPLRVFEHRDSGERWSSTKSLQFQSDARATNPASVLRLVYSKNLPAFNTF